MKRNAKNKKLKKSGEIPLDYKLKIEMELSKKGYIYGTARELSSCLRIPLRFIYMLINGNKGFISDKIRSGGCTYYFIRKRSSKARL